MDAEAATDGLADAIRTVETTARILRGMTELSRRVGGQRLERSCTRVAEDAEQRLAHLRDLSGRAEPEPPRPLRRRRAASGKARNALSPREWQVARLVAHGYTNQQIATELVLTPGTVANHVAHILTKLDLQSRTQVAVWVIQQENTPDA
jgi:DNA-binding NarL/FixJ family response regulator